MKMIIKQEYKKWGKCMNLLNESLLKVSTRPIECMSQACQEYNKLYDTMIETCQKDIISVLENELHYLTEFFVKMDHKLNENKVEHNQHQDIIQYIEKKIKLDSISEDYKKSQEWQEYIDDTIYEHNLFYRLNSKNLMNEEKLYSTYSSALSLYNLNIDNTESFLNKLTKKNTTSTKIEEFTEDLQFVSEKKATRYTNNLEQLLVAIEESIEKLDNEIDKNQVKYTDMLLTINNSKFYKRMEKENEKKNKYNTIIPKLIKITTNKKEYIKVDYVYGK